MALQERDTRDPLATYDALGRKQPKRLGFQEFLRGHPWMLKNFPKTVPGEMFILDGNEVVIACPCKVDPAPRVPFNRVTLCTGQDCGRWFWWNGMSVLVARPETESETVVVD